VSLSDKITEDNTKVQAKQTLNTTYFFPDTTPLEAEVVKDPAAGRYDLKLSP